MSLHQHIDYESEIDDSERAEDVFSRFISETNANKNSVYYDYLLTEENGNTYVNELGGLDGTSGRRALFTEEGFIEGVLEGDLARELKERYEEK